MYRDKITKEQRSYSPTTDERWLNLAGVQVWVISGRQHGIVARFGTIQPGLLVHESKVWEVAVTEKGPVCYPLISLDDFALLWGYRPVAFEEATNWTGQKQFNPEHYLMLEEVENKRAYTVTLKQEQNCLVGYVTVMGKEVEVLNLPRHIENGYTVSIGLPFIKDNKWVAEFSGE